MDSIYEAYLNCYLEEYKPTGEYSIYITCKLSKTLHDQWKSLVTNLDEAESIVDDPHCTFLYAKLGNDVDADKVFNLVKEEIDGLHFDLMPMGFKVFEDVSGGNQDCLVVRLDAPGDIQQIQAELCDKLIINGVELIQDHPVWCPHFTVGYWQNGAEIKYSRPTNGMLDTAIKAKIDYMKINDSKEMNFDYE